MDSAATTNKEPIQRRRNSTYLALACANAVSQGAMTRSLRQMFETQPIRETQPLLSRAEIKQAIQAAKLRRNSIAVCPATNDDDVVTAVPAVVIDTTPVSSPTKPSAASSPVKFIRPVSPTAHMKTISSSPPSSPSSSSSTILTRCDKCSSILNSPPPVAAPSIQQQDEEEVRSKSPSSIKIIPTNREVVEDELPKPDTVKNARCLFESSSSNLMDANSGFMTLQHVKSNPSSKILRSESTMTLDRVGTRSSSVVSRMPPTTFRWPTRHDTRRSPSPSPSPLPATVAGNRKVSTLPAYYRSSPSLTQYRSSRHSLHSTDVESYVSEGGSDCWSSSDLESEASYSSSFGDQSEGLDGMRYISPDVMEKIRSYGMTLTFVNGKMVDEDDDEPEVMEAATKKVIQSIRSAGQSQPMKTTAPPVAQKKSAKATTTPQPRIVACVPKPSEQSPKQQLNNNNTKIFKKNRHSSGESSASSGVSSGGAGSDGSEHNSPFATLKRTKSADADHTLERSPSPGPRQSGTVKAVGSSPFGCYSVVYSFDASARNPTYV